MGSKIIVEVDGKKYEAEVSEAGSGKYLVKIGEKEYLISVSSEGAETVSESVPQATPPVPESSAIPTIIRTPKAVPSMGEGIPVTVEVPGRVLNVLVNEGESVSEGQTIITIESMKMELEIKAPKSGKIKKVLVKKGDSLSAGDVVALME